VDRVERMSNWGGGILGNSGNNSAGGGAILGGGTGVGGAIILVGGGTKTRPPICEIAIAPGGGIDGGRNCSAGICNGMGGGNT